MDEKEIKAIEWLYPFLLKGEKPVIFDVGSNKGTWSDLFLKEFGEDCEVYLFEPNKLLLDFTRVKYDYNKNIVFNECAVTNVHGSTVPFFYFTNYNNGLSSIYRNKRWINEGLPMVSGFADTVSIDQYCYYKSILHIHCMKVDVEGAESLVLSGAKRMLSQGRIEVIQVEYNEHYKLGGHSFLEILDFVEQYGYKAYEFNGDNFVRIHKESFVEDYRFDNFYITKRVIENTQDWNAQFKESVLQMEFMPELALEIGCFEGLTSKFICENMIQPGGRLICVDPMKDEYFTDRLDEDAIKMNESLPYFKDQYQRFLRNTRGLPVELIKKISRDAFFDIRNLRFDFVFIDGDHRKDEVLHDGHMAMMLTREDGFAYILFDDYHWSAGTKEAIDEFLETYKERIEVLVKDQQVLVRKKY